MHSRTVYVVALTVSAAILPVAAVAQIEVRAYYGPAGTTTALTTDASWQWNQTTVHLPYVCPECGYSSANAGVCPDPWHVHGANVALQLVLTPADRILSLAPSDTGSLAVGDFGSVDLIGGQHGRFFVGRPLHPGVHQRQPNVADPMTPADLGRVLRLSAAGLRTGSQARFHIVYPGATRPVCREANQGAGTPDQYPIGPQTAIVTVDPTQFVIGVNPQLAVDDDNLELYVYEEGAAPSRVAVLLHSSVYGWDFFLDSAKDPAVTASSLVGVSNTFISNSGTYRVTIPPVQWGLTAGQVAGVNVQYNRALNGNGVQANCTAMPGPGDVSNGVTAWADAQALLAAPDWSVISPVAPAWQVGGNGLIGDSQPILGGVVPQSVAILAGRVGYGAVSVQWRPTPPAATAMVLNQSGSVYYRTGAEWQYDPAVTVSNAAYAGRVSRFGGASPAHPAQSLYLSSRLEIPKLGDTWTHSDAAATSAGPAEIAASSYARVIMGTHVGNQVTSPEFAPGTQTPSRTFAIRNCNPDPAVPSPLLHCPERLGGCGSYFVSDSLVTCPFDGVQLQPVLADPDSRDPRQVGITWDSAALGGRLLTDLATEPGMYEASRSASPGIPAEAVRLGPADLFGALMGATDGRNGGARLPFGTTANLAAQVEIPRYQSASVPASVAGANWQNDFVRDQGYKGSAVVWDDLCTSSQPEWVVTDVVQQAGKPALGAQPALGALIDNLPAGWDPNQVQGVTRYAGNGLWDQFYKCPDCGKMHPLSGTCRYFHYTAGTPGGYTEATGADPMACPGHFECPTCGNSYSVAQITLLGAGNVCPFDGATLTRRQPNLLTEADLQAEEYDNVDLQVSVSRKVDMIANQATVDLGRTSPGVRDGYPDTTVGIPPAGEKPLGSDLSRVTPTSVGNEGNVTVPSWVATGGTSDSLLSRVDADPGQYGRERLAAMLPINSAAWGGSLFPYTTDGALLSTAPRTWVLASQVPGETASMSAWLNWQAGITAKPLLLGQPLGSYGGNTITFVDLNGNGLLDFWKRSLGLFTTTALWPFDPGQDIALEPVSIAGVQLRVAEARLPYDDFYALDASPTMRFDYSAPGVPSRMQTIWATNRASLSSAANTVALNSDAPAGAGPAATARGDWPINLAYANTGAPITDANDPYYRGYLWSSTQAEAITSTSITMDPKGAGTTNGSPYTYTDAAGNAWLVWHQRLNHAGATQSTLEFASTTDAAWHGSQHIYATGLPKEHIRGFLENGQGQWYFWDSGESGARDVYFRSRFTGTPDEHEAKLPVSNAVPLSARTDVATAADENGVYNRSVKKLSHSPFVYTKDPFPVEMTGITPRRVNCFFAGFSRASQSSDICWTQYDEANLAGFDSKSNFGKMPFARITGNLQLPLIGVGTNPGEQLKSDGLRQAFATRHLDWVIHDDGQGNDFGRNVQSAPWNPRFYVAIVHGTPGYVVPPTIDRYALSWTNPNDVYDRVRGVYAVRPTLQPIAFTGYAAPALAAATVMAGGQLRDRHAVLTGRDVPVGLEIDPASGTLRFSAPLFNIDNPADQECVFNTTLAGCGDILDVVVYGDYQPYVYRITNAGGGDDSPSAFWEGSTTQRLVLFWRRNYAASQPPHFGRSAVMYKAWSLSVPLHYPPVTNLTVDGTAFAATQYDPVNGIVPFSLPDGRSGVTHVFAYTDAAGIRRTERHQVMGWSADMPAPVNSVTAEGPLTVVPEQYQYTVINANTGRPNTLSATRYWLTWASPRAVFDLRAVANNGNAIHQSADIYSAAVTPQFDNLPREQGE